MDEFDVGLLLGFLVIFCSNEGVVWRVGIMGVRFDFGDFGC